MEPFLYFFIFLALFFVCPSLKFQLHSVFMVGIIDASAGVEPTEQQKIYYNAAYAARKLKRALRHQQTNVHLRNIVG